MVVARLRSRFQTSWPTHVFCKHVFVVLPLWLSHGSALDISRSSERLKTGVNPFLPLHSSHTPEERMQVDVTRMMHVLEKKSGAQDTTEQVRPAPQRSRLSRNLERRRPIG